MFYAGVIVLSRKMFPFRYVVLLMLITANTISYVTRVNINLAIVSMVSYKANVTAKTYDVCPLPNFSSSAKRTETTAPKYNWDPSTQGFILGAFAFSYTALQIPSGRFAELFGSKWITAFGLLTSGLINFATPFAATSVFLMTTTRVLLGVCQAGIYPACFLLCTKWFPKSEISTAAGLLSFGTSFGSFLSSVITGYLSEHGFAGGWPSVFYVCGALGVVQSLLFMALVTNSPEESTYLNITELAVIVKDKKVRITKSSPPVPWVKILTCGPVWAYFVGRFLQIFTHFMVATKMPAYMSDILHVQPTKNGLINGLLYLAACSSLATAGGISEKIIISGWMSRTAVRKLFCFISLTIPGVCILAVPWLGCGTLLPSILLITGNFFYGFATGGQIPLATELTTHFVATLVAICNTLCQSAGFLTPYVVGLVLQSSSDVLTSWRIVFGTMFIFLFSGSLVFAFFGDATVQPWDDVEVFNNTSSKNKQLPKHAMKGEKSISIRM